MSLGKGGPERLRDATVPMPGYLRWPVIALTMLFVWPLGAVLLIIRITRELRSTESVSQKKQPAIPYARLKNAQEKEKFLAGQKRRKKRVITAVVISVLFLVLGCYGITKDYVMLFFAKESILKLSSSFFGSAVFLLAGMYTVTRSYALILQGRRFQAVAAAMNGAGEIPVAQLARKLGSPEQTLSDDLRQMADELYFGSGACEDGETGVFFCGGRAEK